MVGQTRSFSHRVRVALATLVSLGVHGCTDVKGGAVELSWKLRAAAGAADVFVACSPTGVLTDSAGTILEDGHLTKIRLEWQATATGSLDFDCAASHGVTTFIVPPGDTLLAVRPVCEGGVEPDPASGTFVAPAPEQRTVIAGDTVSLGAVEIVVQVSQCGAQACVCQ
jgi:hypothetical protein